MTIAEMIAVALALAVFGGGWTCWTLGFERGLEKGIRQGRDEANYYGE